MPDIDLNYTEKKRHWYIYSTGATYGKTTFANAICEHYKAVTINLHDKWFNLVPDDTQIMIHDGYQTNGRWEDIEKFCDGTK